MSDDKQIILPKGEFYIFDACEDKNFEQIYFSSEQALIEQVRWWLKNRTDGFTVFQKKFEK